MTENTINRCAAEIADLKDTAEHLDTEFKAMKASRDDAFDKIKARDAVLAQCEKSFAYCEVRFAELNDNEAALYCTSVHTGIAGLKEKG